MKNINDVSTKPMMFQDLSSSFALCYKDGTIHQIFPLLDSAKYMLQTYNLGDKIYEVVVYKNKIVSNLGEIE